MKTTKLTALTMGAMMLAGSAPAFAAEADENADATQQEQQVSVSDIAAPSGQQEASAEEGNAPETAKNADTNKTGISSEIAVAAGPVKHVLVSGNKTVPDSKILEYVTHTKVGEDYSRDVVMQDVKDIVNSGLVQSAKAKALQSNGELYVVFEVEEVSNVKAVAFEGSTLFTPEELSEIVALKAGDSFDRETVHEDSERIRNAYADNGFIAIVGNVNNNDGVVTYHINEARVGGVHFIGNTKTKDWVLEKLTRPYLQDGALLRNADLQGAYNSLAGTGYFSEVKIEAEDIYDPEDPGKVMLNVTVKETSTGAWNVGGAYSDTYGAELVGGIYDRNLGGSAKSVALDFGIGTERNHYSLTFTDPYWRKSNSSVYAKAFRTGKTIDNDYYEYDENHTGGEIGFYKPISRDNRTTMYANARVDKIDVDDQKRGPELESLQENTLTLGVTHNNVNMATGSGSILEGSVTSSLKALGSDYDFSKFMLSAKGYQRLSNRDMLAARAVINYSPDHLPGIEQFTIGGADSVRGMEEDEQRGDQSILASVEYRHDFSDKFQGVVFVDAGQAWSDEVHNSLKVAAGLGLRLNTAMGVLRLDVAQAQDSHKPKFLFGFGHSF